MHVSTLDPADLRLLHALQIDPRASFSDIAAALRTDPATVSRRWSRLREGGYVWITGVSGTRGLDGFALIDVDCEPSRLTAVADELARDHAIITIERTAGGRDLLLTVNAGSADQLSRFIVDRLTQTTGVRAVRTHIVVDIFIEGGTWRLRELSPAEAAAIPGPAKPRPRAPKTLPPHLVDVVRHELSLDGRATPTEIGRRWDVPAQRVSDTIAVLRQDGRLRMRTDISRRVSDWPVYTWYFVQVPSSAVPRLRAALTTVPEVRLAALTAGRYNLVLAVWLRDLASIHGFEAALERAVPGAHIDDRSVVMRIHKHLGHLLDDDGLATGEVIPVSPPPEL
ncbi:Lrp/AsnC family transcriptional regulator [Aeromicrobium sp. YIM 150415]|uniref:Lrp/AsnC family transcriptional regulator n=1 Tax=Aeromicrobium sp. YIM 150415 TaxID=2803912 RepID=UPI001965079E|nr:Lrp/AsnC family transcriptional regulator [Aeromicrobium sp. YIM 150415]MBM9465350.1 Lrp/AsnC family transcriptional regulator [Aeromicrobium sp. YIM 150415]